MLNLRAAALQGALAPFFASGALFGGYLLIKFFPTLSIESFLNAYFWLIGSIAVAGAAGAPLRSLVSISNPRPLPYALETRTPVHCSVCPQAQCDCKPRAPILMYLRDVSPKP